MKKIKKLVLNKRVISNLNKVEMNQIRAGEKGYLTECILFPYLETCDLNCNFPSILVACTDILGDCATSDMEVNTCEAPCH